MGDSNLIIVAIIGFFGQTLAVVIGAILNQRSAQRAQQAAANAQIATAVAAENAAKAQIATADAARALVMAARASDTKLEQIQQTSKTNMEVTEATHKIVNNQRTVMLTMVAALSRRIAQENPNDDAAQLAAVQADSDVRESSQGNQSRS